MKHPHCNIELGKKRLIKVTEWKVEIRIDIREWESRNGKKSLQKKGSASRSDAGNAGEQSPLPAPGLLRKQGEQKSSRRKRKRDISTQQRLCEYQYWFAPNQSHLVPTKKAITLSPTEYSQLKDPTSIMDDFVPEVMLVVPYPYQSDHMNQLGKEH
jgi:hypothetical protein